MLLTDQRLEEYAQAVAGRSICQPEAAARATALLARAVQNQAYVLACIDGFMVLGFAVISALFLMLFLRDPQARLNQPAAKQSCAVATPLAGAGDAYVAVVDSGGNLVTFARMDGAQLASIAISEHKARVAAKYRRPTKAIEEGVQKGVTILMTLDDVIASRGGIPLIEDGKLIGAIGCSGATGSQDEVVCSAGAASINR